VPEPPAAPAVPEPAAPPAPPVVAAKPPEAPEPAPRPRLAPEATPEGPPSESPLAWRGFSLLRPRIEVPPLPGPPLPGGGGTRPEGEGAGEAGRERQGQAAIPLHEPPDPNYAEYFLEIKKRIEANLVYPHEAARQGQSGQLVLEFVVKKDGSLRLVDLVRSSGVAVLDRYSVNTVRLAAPFPPIPDRLGVDSVFIRASFTYVLDHGFRVFGLR
ncbi:MAG: energy transducer TonB, partial [Candidatus Rokubacteria bacterium]|nr:energy transducer TonB [Candidatus Rokubacteria bacterium]